MNNQLGWRSITGSVIVGIGYALKALSSFYPDLDKFGDALISIGVMLGGYGFRKAISDKKMGGE
jgi:hypothetical protein